MDYSEAANRISRKFASGGETPDVKKIEGKLKRLVDEFGVQPSEAERSVTNELAKEFNLPAPGFGTTAGSTGKNGGTEEKKIAEGVPGEWVTIEGKIVALAAPASPSIAQSGIIADESGAIRFVVWAKSNAPAMADGSWYRIESAVVDEYKGVANLKIHSGTTIKEITEDRSLIPTPTPIKDLRPGIGGIRAKFVQEWDASHERMLQSGLLGDETGTIKFVIWKEPGKEKLVPGAVYNIFYAQVDEFNGRLSLNLNAATILQEEGEIEVSGGEATMTGAIVHIAPGSGIIKRCPVEGCNRALSRQNYCPVHEIQPKFVYDLRIKGWLDDGEKTHNVLIQRDVVESLTGISLAQAQEIAENNPLGMDEVFIQMREKILGRYIQCSGREIDGRLLVNKCEKIAFSTAEHTALLNRAGGAPS
ncbi:nucleotide-binding protein [Methanoregula sp.]|uniref:nucleotide-binding protein n=1 Tax=Methanoregula sp. TaxID=2052170 RepID=UPI00236E926A|nr:nucleotide-binding protein [Methanoregula sp.]MDD1687386.1 nucleotide-binding protein [Methanoregula sp.]